VYDEKRQSHKAFIHTTTNNNNKQPTNNNNNNNNNKRTPSVGVRGGVRGVPASGRATSDDVAPPPTSPSDGSASVSDGSVGPVRCRCVVNICRQQQQQQQQQ
jgi:hypothetical protein